MFQYTLIQRPTGLAAAELYAAWLARKAALLGVSPAELAKPGALKVTRDGDTVKITLARDAANQTVTLDETYAGTLEQAAMYRNPAKSITEFRDNAASGKSGPSWFRVNTPNGTQVDITNSEVKHFHAENDRALTDDELNDLVNNLDNIEEYAYTEGTRGLFGGQPVLAKVNTPSGKFGVTLEYQPSGRIFAVSGFKSTEKGVNAWIKKEGAHALAESKTFKQGDPLNASHPSMIKSIQQALGIVKQDETYNQAAATRLNDDTIGRDNDIPSPEKSRVNHEYSWSTPDELKASFKNVSAEAYIEARGKSKRKMFLTPYTAEQLREMEATVYLTDEGVGFALKPDGDLIGVFNNSRRAGAGRDAIILAIAEGAKTLDCVGDNLEDYYKMFGFVEKGRVKWDDKLAPDGWEYSAGGRPDVIFLEYPQDLGRAPSDVARRLELARDRQLPRGTVLSGGDSGVDAEVGKQTRSGTLLGGTEVSPGTDRVLADDVGDNPGPGQTSQNAQSRPQKGGSLLTGGGTFNQMGQAARAALNADAAAWKNTIRGELKQNATDKRGKPIKNMRRVMATPLALTLAGAKKRSIRADMGKLWEATQPHKSSQNPGGFDHGHNLSVDTLRNLPEALADPVMVLQSETRNDSIVVVTEMTDANGATVIVPIQLETRPMGYVVNLVTSMYGRTQNTVQPDGSIVKENDAEWFLEQITSPKGLVKYVNKKKTSLWGSLTGLYSAEGTDIEKLFKNIPDETDLVKLWNANPGMYQEGGDSGDARGNITFYRERAVITLFKNADRSTLLHEMAHFFMQDMFDTARRDGAPDALRADWATLAGWLGAEGIDPYAEMSDEQRARWTAAHEKFATAFERYLMEGRAPSAELKSVFRRFRDWLVSVYKTVSAITYTDADGTRRPAEINDEIRAVFDRMIASDEAIEAAAIMEEMTSPGDGHAAADREITAAASERLYARILRETEGAARDEILAAAERTYPLALEALEREPAYRAVAAIRENPALKLDENEILDTFGDTTAANMPEGVTEPDGAPLDAAAAAHGFANPAEMIDALASAGDAQEEAWRRAVDFAMRERGATTAQNIAARAAEALADGEEATDADIAELLEATNPELADAADADADGAETNRAADEPAASARDEANGVAPTTRQAGSASEAAQIIRNSGIVDKPLTNEKFGITATISENSLSKMVSEKAVKKSVSPRLHALALANVDTLFENADIHAAHPDEHGNEAVKQIHRFGALIKDGKDYHPVKVTVKEFINPAGESRIYTVEAVDVEKIKNSAGRLVPTDESHRQVTPIAEFNDKILQLLDDVKRRDAEETKNSAARTSPTDESLRQATPIEESDTEMDAYLAEKEKIDAEAQNPLHRKNLMKWIREHGGLSLRKIRNAFGKQEADALLDRKLGPRAWSAKDNAMGLDEAAAEMAAEGIPVQDDRHLYALIVAEDAPTTSAYDQIYQEGWNARRADEREKRMKKRAKQRDARVRALADRQDFRALKDSMEATHNGKDRTKAETSERRVSAAICDLSRYRRHHQRCLER